ncbi:hypothetical protein EMIHUDRAFT_257464, partial [Emiliania huxleyi CCMP1516]|uniref:Replication protein A C-terminal domain-containing protein n=2 Tax=Emiliania huxleyi TaxID=2903 RepID=A0A0D3IJ25_EMIH1
VKRVLSFHLPGPVEPNSVYTEQWNEEECTCTLTFPITPPAPPDPGEYLSSGPGGSVPLAAAAAIEEPSGCGAGVGSGVHGSSASALEGSDQVLEYFKQFGDHSEAGCAIAQCHEAMAASGVSLEQIRNQVNQLVSDGHLYSTIDDDHYKAI